MKKSIVFMLLILCVSIIFGCTGQQSAEEQIKKAYVQLCAKDGQEVTTEDITVECYGVFEDAYVGFYKSVYDIPMMMATQIEIDGIVITFPTTLVLKVYQNGQFISLVEAYEETILTRDNLLTVKYNYENDIIVDLSI